MVGEGVSGRFCGLDIAEEFEIALRDDAVLDHFLKVYDLVPEIFFTKQQNGDRRHLACLKQGQRLEKFVHRAEAARKGNHGAGAQEEM